MTKLEEYRARFPEYNDLDDETLLRKRHAKHYADMPYDEYRARMTGGAGAQGPSGAKVGAQPAPPPKQNGGLIAGAGRFIRDAAVEAGKDIVAYPQAKLIDPAKEFVRGATSMAKGGRFTYGRTPEEEERATRGRAVEVGALLGGAGAPLEMAAAKMGAKPLLARLLGRTGGGSIGGAADAAIRTGGDPGATLAGAGIGGALGMATTPIRGAVPKPAAPKAKPAPSVSPPVSEEVSPFVRMSGQAGKDTGAVKRGLKTLALGYHHPDPLAAGIKLSSGESLTDALVAARRPIQDAEERALLESKEFWNPRLTGKGAERAQQMDLIRQHATAESFLEGLRAGKKLPEGYSPEQLDKDYVATAIELSRNPEAAAAYKDFRALMNEKHAELTKRGYNVGFQKGYLPDRALEETDRLMPPSQTRAGRTPGFMKKRGAQQNVRSSDVPHLMGEYLTQYNKKIAEDDLFTKLHADPGFNLAATDEGRKALRKTGIPEGYVRFEAQMGAPGFGKTRVGKHVQVEKAAKNALLVRKDLIQRAAREADEAAKTALKRAEKSRRQANLLEDKAKAISAQRAALAKNVEKLKARSKRFGAKPELDPQYAAAKRAIEQREPRLAKMEERERVLIEKARAAQEKVARSEAQSKATSETMRKKAVRLMAKAEKVGQRAERGKQLSKRRSITMVIPRDAAEALGKFYPGHLSEAGKVANKVGSVMAQTATTFNPANRMLNLPSDLWMTMAGPAGERGTITSGIAARRLARYPSALASTMKGAFGGESKAYDAARKAGAVSGTFQHEIEGVNVPHDLRKFYWPEKKSAGQKFLSALTSPIRGARAFSTATEAAPRAAAQQEAARRGLPFEEQSRLAHEVSLPYGTGTSAWSKSSLSKLLSRFSTYPGLADVRIAQGLTKKGSRLRYAALATIPPLVAAEWNTQDPEHAAYEKKLKPWVKSSLHVNHKDENGEWQTYVIRADPFSEAANRWGVGQLPGRILKAAKGGEPLSFADAPKQVQDAYLNFYPLGPAVESIKGETKYRKKLETPLDRIANMAPVVRLGKEALEAEGKESGAGGQLLIDRVLKAGARPYRAEEVRK